MSRTFIGNSNPRYCLHGLHTGNVLVFEGGFPFPAFLRSKIGSCRDGGGSSNVYLQVSMTEFYSSKCTYESALSDAKGQQNPIFIIGFGRL